MNSGSPPAAADGEGRGVLPSPGGGTVPEADRRFVRETTRRGTVPLLPEVTLHLADDPIALWERTEERAGVTDSPPPFWAFAWAGGQALARHLLDDPAVVRGRAVLDLAAGSGLVAVAAALCGAGPVVANEIEPLAAAAITLNAEANGVTVIPVLADLLDAGRHDISGHDISLDDIDVVLAGDVCYDRRMTARVVPFLDRMARRGATVLLGDPGRAYLPRERLEVLTGYDVPVTRELEDVDVRRTSVCRFVAGPDYSPALSSVTPPAR
ncbi:MAG: methyltransferase [Actinomycetales bacterium]|nr:methyltransferase [Actinomycetales bacterium]